MSNAPSITSWVRLEPRSRDAEMNSSLEAKIYDPLWLLSRQWQLGEFAGEDNGSPVIARWRGETARLNRFRPGSTNSGPMAYDPGSLPLETMAERERVRPETMVENDKAKKLMFAIRAGQHFLRLLDKQPRSRPESYSGDFVAKFPIPPLTDDERKELDAESLSLVDLVSARVPDGRELYKALRQPNGGVNLSVGIEVLVADLPQLEIVTGRWLQWCDSFFSEPNDSVASWNPDRMEYSLSVAGKFAESEKVLTAQEYFEGHLDWHSFDLDEGASLGASEDVKPVTCTTIPAPVSFRGMPAARFWEFEDAQINFGAVDAGPTDLARMLLVEFALAYGNDWFVIPVELEVGTLCRTSSLFVTDTFGVRTLIKSSSEMGPPHSACRMFQLSNIRKPETLTTAPVPNLFFLAPSLLRALESKPIEEVLFLRDEMANMAWAVERLIESSVERPLNRYEAYTQHKRLRDQEIEPGASASEALRYSLVSEVPDYWIPLLPTRVGTGLRLKRGAVLKSDGSHEPATAQGRVLESGEELSLFEEEVPREGVRVTRSFQFTRWTDGSSHLWIGRRKDVGRGEGSSGLRFDNLEEES